MTRPIGRRASPAVCTADCIADSAGGITFDVTDAARPGATLVLRRRADAVGTHGGGDDEVRLPLTGPATASGAGPARLRAVLPSTVELAEGHWDIFTGTSGDQPVRPGIRDVRALIDRVPGTGPVAARVPYPTADGRLALRTWLRAPHAEAGTVRCAPAGMSVEGVLYGAELGEHARAEARLHGGDRTHRVAVTGRGGVFAFTLPYGPLAEEPGGPGGEGRRWDLWLLPAPDTAGIRISRILDDIWDKRAIHVYPAHAVPAHGTDGRLAAPGYTHDNDFCVRLDPAPAPVPTP
ncbi:transferase [Streptomyces scopuliridis]|uniref:Transferase n=1 Tax=Streptomyces scopuliridis TaxID=452529 RepID=A0ACD4ZSX1_9ACTN|nr:transferase [Streptomyces scopuliridis]WSC00898.1 transferase [Streptomyces scopuliridis]WSC05492.1 transferase [Streptomyces scopuliridis]